MNPWIVPPTWMGCTAVCIGGGPSLTPEDVDYVRDKANVIAINDAYKLAPWANILYACDLKWWNWHGGVPEFKHIKATQDKKASLKYDLKYLQQTFIDDGEAGQVSLGFDAVPGNIRTGRNSGYQAMHLAMQLGATKIILLGYDMQFKIGRAHV